MDELFQLTDTNFSVVLCVFVSRWWVRWMCVFSCFPCDVEAFSLTVGPVNKKMLLKLNSTIDVMVDGFESYWGNSAYQLSKPQL